MNTYPSCDFPNTNHKKEFIKIHKKYKHVTEIDFEFCKSEKPENLPAIKIKPDSNSKSLKFTYQLYLIEHLLIPNLLGGIIYAAICYIDKNLPCDDESSNLIFLKISLNVFFEKIFYPLLGYFMSILWIIKQVPENNQLKQKIIIISLFFVESFIFEYLFWKKLIENFILLQVALTFTGLFYSCMLCKNYKLLASQFKPQFYICLTYFLMLFLNAYIVKNYIIYNLNKQNFFDSKIYFKLIVFLYFQFYRMLANFLTKKYSKILKFRDPFVGFMKLVLTDIISSLIVPVMVPTKTGDNKLFVVLLLIYQLSIFYLKKNPVIEMGVKFIEFLFNKKRIKKETKLNRIFNEILTVFMNEIMIIIYVKLILLYYFRKFVAFSKMGEPISTTCFHFKENIQMEIEYIPLIVLVQVAMAGTYFLGRTNQNLQWTGSKMTKIRIFKRIYHIILSYNYVDIYFQFYFYLAFV